MIELPPEPGANRARLDRDVAERQAPKTTNERALEHGGEDRRDRVARRAPDGQLGETWHLRALEKREHPERELRVSRIVDDESLEGREVGLGEERLEVRALVRHEAEALQARTARGRRTDARQAEAE